MKLVIVATARYYQAAAACSIWLLLLSSLSTCHGAGARSATVRGLQGNSNPNGGSSPIFEGRLALINAITDTKVMDLVNDTIIDLSRIDGGLARPAFNIDATFSNMSMIKFVQYGYNTTMNYRIEKTAPYAFCGNVRTDFFECPILGYGTHTVSVIAWGRNGMPLGPVYSVTFTIVNSRITLAPTPYPSRAPSAVPPTTPYPSRAPSVTLAPTLTPGLQSLISTTSLTVNVTNQSSAFEFVVVLQDFAPTPLISSGYISLSSANGYFISSVPFAVNQATTDRLLKFTVRLPIPRFIAPGAYSLNMEITGGSGFDTLVYNTDKLMSLSFPFQVIVHNLVTDVDPPKLLNIEALTPLSINVTKNPATVKFRFTVSDDLSGLSFLSLTAISNGTGYSTSYVNQKSIGMLAPMSFNLSLPFAANFPTAAYQLRVNIYDNSNNGVEYYPTALANLGFPSSFEVVNANARGNKPPFLISIKALSSTAVDVSTGPRTVDIQVTVQDDISGFQYGEVLLLEPITGTNISCTVFAPTTVQAAVPLSFNVTVRIPRYVPAGAYIFQFILRDALSVVGYSTDLDGLRNGVTYFPIQVANSIVDVTPPELLNFTVSPRTVDPLSGTSNVTFTIVVRDDLSGIRRDQNCVVTVEDVGGVYISRFFFPHFDTPGLGTQTIVITATFDETVDWRRLYSLDLRFADAALNTVRFTSRALVQRGFAGFLPTSL